MNKNECNKISIFEGNYVLRIVTQKLYKNELIFYNVCQPRNKTSSLKRKVPANLEKDVCMYFAEKNKLGMCDCWCEIKSN